jgi:hypothetical protein
MATYRISGVWKTDGVITHYAFHTLTDATKNTVTQVQKISKADAILLLEAPGNSATTLVWNYTHAGWYVEETVQVVGSGANKYLRSNPDKQVSDNLGHLPNYSLIY